jgi:hypothetical protein
LAILCGLISNWPCVFSHFLVSPYVEMGVRVSCFS